MRSLEEIMGLDDIMSATLEEGMELYETAAAMLKEDLSHGMTSTQKLLDVSFNPCALLDAGLSYHAQATGALCRLRYWTATNGYATGLRLSQILQSYTLGSALLRELIDALSNGADAWQEVAYYLEKAENTWPVFGTE